MKEEKKTAKIHKNLCAACGTCLKACPMTAITVINGCFAHADPKRCVGCGRCVNACPASIITLSCDSDTDF